MTARETILVALMTLASTATGFTKTARRLEMPSKVTNFPALYVISTGESYPPRDIRGLPPKRTINAQIWLYTDGGKDPLAAPEVALNNAIDALETALQPTAMASVQTLGVSGVQHCWIEGEIEKYPGVLDGIAKAIVPVKILTA